MEPDVSEILSLTREQGELIDKFVGTQTARIDELEKKLNRPFADSGTPSAGRGALVTPETPEQRKSLDLGFRAWIGGDHAKAYHHFAEAKGMSVGIDPDGGYLVAPTLSTEMTRVMLEVAPFIGLARTVELTQGDSFEEPVDKNAAGYAWVGETQSRGDSASPQLGMFTCPLHELEAQPKATQKLIDTARIDVMSWLSGKVGEAFAYGESDAFFNGTGVAKPRGFLNYPTAATADATRAWGTLEHVVTGANGAFGASNPSDILIDLIAALKPQYRAGATWAMNRATAAQVRKMKDGQGRYLWTDGLLAGQPPVLLGYPVLEMEQMPDISTGSLSIAFGNFKRGYTIVRRLGVRFLADPYTDKPNVKLYSIERVGGGVNNSEAIKLLKFST